MNNFERKNTTALILTKLFLQFGIEIFTFSLSLFILKTTGSAITFAFSLIIANLPAILFGYFAGAFGDKYGRKKVIVLSCALLSLSMFIYFIVYRFISWQLIPLYIMDFFVSAVQVFLNTSLDSSYINLVTDDNITRINSIGQSVDSLVYVVCPFVAGILNQYLKMNFILLICCCTFLLSAIAFKFTIYAISKNINEFIDRHKTNIKDIMSNLYSNKIIFTFLIFIVIINTFMAIGFTVPYPYIVNDMLKLGSFQYGLLESALGIGMSLMSFLIILIKSFKNRMKLITIGTISIATFFILFGIVAFIFKNMSNSFFCTISLFVIFVCISSSMILMRIPYKVILQKQCPENIRGRLIGVYNSIVMIFYPIGVLFAGFISDKVNAMLLPIFSGVILVISVIGMNIRLKYYTNISTNNYGDLYGYKNS